MVGQRRVHPLEDALCALFQVRHVGEGVQRLAVGIHVGIPGAQNLQPEARGAFLGQFPRERRHLMLDGVVECGAVVRRIVEASGLQPTVIPIIGEIGLRGDLPPHRQHLEVEIVQFAAMG